MREIRSYGSVRGVAGDRYPYRDLFFSCSAELAGAAVVGALEDRASALES